MHVTKLNLHSFAEHKARTLTLVEEGGGWPLMSRCSAIKPNGEHCKGTAVGPHGYCWSHDPQYAEKRSRMASRAGRAKPGRKEISELKGQLSRLAEDVRSGKLDPKIATVVNQIINTRLRALEMERAIRETDELAAEIEELKREYSGAA
jgi:hypothetical protein